MKSEDLIIEAINCAIEKNIKLIRGPILNWCDPNDSSKRLDIPSSCNAIGAILLKLNKESLLGTSEWLKEICEYLGENYFWIWKFNSGFDYGNQITLTFVEGEKEKSVKDKVSALGIKIARQFKV